MHGTSLSKSTFADVKDYASQDEIPLDLAWTVSPVISVPIRDREERTQTQGRMPWEDGRRDGSDASSNQDTPDCPEPPGAGRGGKESPCEPLEGAQPR